MGTWIEIARLPGRPYGSDVVPYVGTWIEIATRYPVKLYSLVVPYVGTWIEISSTLPDVQPSLSRSLRGNVDRNAFVVDNANTLIPVVPYVGTWIEI